MKARLLYHTCTLAVLLLMTTPVQAHAPLEGFGSFSNGFLHPLIIPAQVLLIVSLGLLTGRQGSLAIRHTLLLFFVSLFLGVFLSQFISLSLEILFAVSALILAAVLISGRFLALPWLYAIGVISGVLVGMDSLIDGFLHKERYFALLGSIVASYLLLVYSSGIAEFMQTLKEGIALRVLGSWIATSCFLLVALSVLL